MIRVFALGGRCIRLASRNVDAMLEALVLPIMVMLVFVYLFGGAIHVEGEYVNYVVPGVLVLNTTFGSAFTAISVNQDMSGRVIDRFRTLDVPVTAILGGHILASSIRNMLSVCTVLAVALAIGFRPQTNVQLVLVAQLLLLMHVVAISSLSALVGLVLSSPEAATGYSFFAFFLVNPSSALVPVETMPSWIQGFAQHQPLSAVCDALRALLLESRLDGVLWAALGWSLAIIIASSAISGIAFRRRVR